MRSFQRLILLLVSGIIVAVNCYAASIVIESGTLTTVRLMYAQAGLRQLAKNNQFGFLMQNVALQMLNKPYSSFLLDRQLPEYLWISTEHTDCMLFVEHVWAISMLIKTGDNSASALESYIKQIRYHGQVNYCNRNHYFKDWALSGQAIGIFNDEGFRLASESLPTFVYYLSNKLESKSDLHHKDLACILNRENLLNREQLGFIPMGKLSDYLGQIKPGDIIGVVRDIPGIDVAHMGIAYVKNGQLGMIHASSKEQKVVLTKNLLRYLKQFRNVEGIVVLRPNGEFDAKVF